MDENRNLADELIKFEKIATSKTTVDDFFDYAGIPTHQRSDFTFCCIMRQAEERKRMQKAFAQAETKFKALAQADAKLKVLSERCGL